MLLFLFGSKDGLVAALLARARADELAVLDRVRRAGAAGGPSAAAEAIWAWLAAPEHRALLTLWLEAYARALVERDGAWAGFAARTVRDWLGLLAELGPAGRRRRPHAAAGRAAGLPARPARHRRRRPHRRRRQRYLHLVGTGVRA